MDRKMRRMCGTKSSNIRNDVESDGNFFRVTFMSNDAFDATGFEAFYQFRKYEGTFARLLYSAAAKHFCTTIIQFVCQRIDLLTKDTRNRRLSDAVD